MKNKNKKIFINEDLTPFRANMLKMNKELPAVKNATTQDGKKLVWLTDRDRSVEISTPDDLHKVGITSPDWKKLKVDYIVK